MLMLFCRDPLESARPDRAFAAENAVIEHMAIPYVLFDYEALVRENDPSRVLRRIPDRPQPTLAVYRGWMLAPDQYQKLHEGLATRNIRLVNDPEQYRHAHHLPENYDVIRHFTPRSVWLSGDLDMGRVHEALSPFGDGPVIVKDYAKSQKHEWAEACFIPSASDRERVRKVVERFLELQGSDLNEGLVFREFVEFEPIGVHPRSGMPLTEEYRGFWLDGRLLFWSPYWAEGDYANASPAWIEFTEVAAAIRSRFFTMDLARTRDGRWMIVELGDGQVSGLPRPSDAPDFYRALVERGPTVT